MEELIEGRDGIARAAKLRAGTTIQEGAVQQLYPLELSCDRETAVMQAQLNRNAPAFRPRRDRPSRQDHKCTDKLNCLGTVYFISKNLAVSENQGLVISCEVISNSFSTCTMLVFVFLETNRGVCWRSCHR